MTTLTEGQHAGEFIVSENEGHLSREIVTVASGQNLKAGTVYGRIGRQLAAAPIPAVVGTGNGTLYGLKAGPNVQSGNYVIKCTAIAANAGTFSVTAPDGKALPDATVGVPYKSTHLDFTLNDGSTDFAVNDTFTVAVTAGGTPVVVGTGNGTISGITMGRKTQTGTYRLECTAAATNGGTFKVVAPNGAALPNATVGTAFADEQINFTINDGSSDFVVGDYFHVVVAQGSKKVTALAPSAVDGSEVAAGLLFDNTDATSGDKKAVGIERNAEVNKAELIWPAGITAAQQDVALLNLATQNVVAR